MSFIKNQFMLTNAFFRKRLGIVFFVLLAEFVTIAVIGYVTIGFFPDEALQEVWEYISGMFDSKGVISGDGTILFLPLLANNLYVAVISCVFGFVPFLFIPLFIFASNAYIVGIVVGLASTLAGENPLFMVLTSILPHGIFEIPAVLLAWSAGFYVCLLMCKKIFGKGKDEKLSFAIKRIAGLYCFYIIPLLIAAAFVEAVVLPVFLF